MPHRVPDWLLPPAMAHAPLLALAVALAARLLGGVAGWRRLRGAAAALGLLAGWAWLALPALSGPPAAMAREAWRAVLVPAAEAGRLSGAALVLLAAGLLMPATGRPGRVVPLLLGALLGWWLAGAPAHGEGLVHGIVAAVTGAMLTLGALRLLRDGDAWRGTAAALALAAALLAAGAPAQVTGAALVEAAAVAALLPGSPQAAMLVPAAGLVAAALVAELADGMAARHSPSALDLACLAPIAVLLLAPRLLPRLSRAGPALAGLLIAGACVVLVWGPSVPRRPCGPASLTSPVTPIIIFGAAVLSGGQPSVTLRRRVEAAVRLGATLPDPLYLPTGGSGRHPPAEAAVMTTLLHELGVPAASILPEPTAVDTLSSVLACRRLLRQRRHSGPVFAATSAYHLPRCLALLRLAGLQARACPPPPESAAVSHLQRWFWRLREVPAVPVDVVLLGAWLLLKRM